MDEIEKRQGGLQVGDTVVWWKRLPGGDFVYPVEATILGFTEKRVKIEARDERETAVRYVKPESLQREGYHPAPGSPP